MLRQGLIVGAAGIVAIVLAMGGSSEPPEAKEAAVAGCGRSSSPATIGAVARPERSAAAGSLRLPGRPLVQTVEVRSGQFAARMPVVLRGHDYIVLSVPFELRKRVFLYYGRAAVPPGRPLGSLRGPGYAEVEFQPCRDRARTGWPGAIRVIGRAPVRLLETIEGQPRSIPLALGSPATVRQARTEDSNASNRAFIGS